MTAHLQGLAAEVTHISQKLSLELYEHDRRGTKQIWDARIDPYLELDSVV